MNRQKSPEACQHFRLYIARTSPSSLASIRNIKPLLKEKLGDAYTLDTIDVFEAPEAAEADKIAAVPTLIRVHPKPVKRLVGDLSDRERVCLMLGFSEEIDDEI